MSEQYRENPLLREQQWMLLEEHYHTGKPVRGRFLEILDSRHMLVDVEGIQGIIENFVFAFTWNISEALHEEKQRTREERIQQELKEMKGKEILLRVIGVDRESEYPRFSLYVYDNEELKTRKRQSQQLLEELQPGDTYKGIVTSINNHIVNVDLNGVRGKLPSFSLTDQPLHVDPLTIVQVGQEITVMIVRKQRDFFWLSLYPL